MHHLKITLTGFFLLLAILAKSQVAYKPMLSDYKEWLVKTCEFGNCLFDYYWLAEDSMHNGLAYKVLDGYHYNRNFLLREDVAKKQVFVWFDDGSGFPQDILLYDFSLQVGDSLYVRNPISPVISSEGYYHLDSIVNKFFEQIQRRVFYLSSSDTSVLYKQTRWIEGIGSTALINTPGAVGDTSLISTLLCSLENGNKIFSRKSNDSCYTNPKLSTAESLVRATKVDLWYSNTDDHLYTKQLPKCTRLRVLDSFGRLAYVQENLPSKESISLIHLKPGVYMLYLEQNETIIHSLKLVKVR
jgi:hypothetical protein